MQQQGMYGTKAKRPVGWMVTAVASLLVNVVAGGYIWHQSQPPSEPTQAYEAWIPGRARLEPSVAPALSGKGSAESSETDRAIFRELAGGLDSCSAQLSRTEAENAELRSQVVTAEEAARRYREKAEKAAYDLERHTWRTRGGAVTPVLRPRQADSSNSEENGLGVAYSPRATIQYDEGIAIVDGEVGNPWSGETRGYVVVDLECGDDGGDSWSTFLTIGPNQRESYSTTLSLPFGVQSGCRVTARWEEEG